MSYVILLLRKPLSESCITENLRRWGCGAIHIDACRIAADETYRKKCESVVGLDSNVSDVCYGEWKHVRENSWSAKGRWPANVILLHEPQCTIQDVEDGSYTINQWDAGAKVFGGTDRPGESYTSHTQTVPVEVWDCSCALGAPPDTSSWHTFFKQVNSEEALWKYLRALIEPPGGKILSSIRDLQQRRGHDYYHGAVLDLSSVAVLEALLRWVLDSLRPGAHALIRLRGDDMGLFAVDAAHVGFEVRETIYVTTEDYGTYVPKAKPKERERLLLEEETYLDWEASLAPPRKARKEKVNTHQSVKPERIFARVMEDVEGKVLDPFLGSGTCAVASLQQGHDCIGVEMSPKHIKIAAGRVRAELEEAPLKYVGSGVRIEVYKTPEERLDEEQHVFEAFIQTLLS